MTKKNFTALCGLGVVMVAVSSTAAMPPIAQQARDFTVTSIRKHTVAEHPESLFIRVWKQGAALELARGLRFALDVEVGAARVASNSGRE